MTGRKSADLEQRRPPGIEPGTLAPKASILPLNHGRSMFESAYQLYIDGSLSSFAQPFSHRSLKGKKATVAISK